MRRREDWPERLARYLHEKRDTPFSWGENCCARFTAGAVEAMTDTRLFEAPYTNAREALEYQEEHSMESMLDSLLLRAVRGFVSRGDVVMLTVNDRTLLGVCVGDLVAAPGIDGVLYAPLDSMTAAWKV